MWETHVWILPHVPIPKTSSLVSTWTFDKKMQPHRTHNMVDSINICWFPPQVLQQGWNPGIQWEYTLSKEDTDKRNQPKHNYTWAIIRSQCSATCAGGTAHFSNSVLTFRWLVNTCLILSWSHICSEITFERSICWLFSTKMVELVTERVLLHPTCASTSSRARRWHNRLLLYNTTTNKHPASSSLFTGYRRFASILISNVIWFSILMQSQDAFDAEVRSQNKSHS